MAERKTNARQEFKTSHEEERTSQFDAAWSPEMVEALSLQKRNQALKEIKVHQLELENQNQELRRTQAELITSRDLFFELYDMAPQGYCTLSESGLILEANLTMGRMLGVTRAGLIGQSATTYIHADDLATFQYHRHELLESGILQNCEVRLRKMDGTSFWAQIAASVAQDSDFTPLCHLIISDISDRKLMSDTLFFLARQPWVEAGEDFFLALARFLALTLGMDYVCIDRLEGEGLSAQTVSIYFDGKFEDNISYALKDTPCGDVVGKDICLFPKNVRYLFPNDGILEEMVAESYIGTTLVNSSGQSIGLIAIIGRQMLKNVKLAEDILRIVAVRAASELERRMVEERILEGETRLVRAQTVSQVGSWEIDLRNQLMWASAEAFRIYGLDRSASPYIPLKLAQSIPLAEDRPRLDAALAGLLHEDKKYDLEFRILRGEDRTLRVIHSVAELVRDSNGQPLKVLGVFQDITEKKQTEEALLENNTRLNLALKVSKSGIWEWDLEHQKIFWSDELWKLIGLDPQSNVPSYETWLKAMVPEDRPEVELAVQEALRTGQDSSVEWRVQAEDGRPRWLMSRSHPVLDASGKVLHITGAVMDVTERKQAETALRESEARYRGLVEDINDVLYELDNEARITYISPVIESFTGFRPDEIIGKSITALIDPRDMPLIRERLSSVLAGRTQPSEYRIIGKQGRLLWVRSSSKPILENGQTVGLRGVMVNISEMKQAEEAMRTSEERYRQLFDDSPIPMLEQDFSLVKQRLDHIHSQGIIDFKSYFETHLEEVKGLLSLVRVTAENKASRKQRYHFTTNENNETLEQIIPLDSIGSFIDELVHLANGGTEYRGEAVNLKANGEKIDVRVHWSVVPGYRESLAKIIVTIEDITERKRAIMTLRESEARFKAVSEYSHNAIGLVDESGKITWFNEAFLKLGNYTREQIQSARTFEDFIAPESLEFVTANFINFVRKKSYEHHYSFFLIRADGQKRLCEKHMTDYEDRNGKRVLAISMVDITERMEAEKALQESETRFRQIFESSAIGISLCDLQGRFFSGNPSILKILDYSLEEYCRLTLNDVSHPLDLAEDMRLYQELWDGKCEYYVMEKRNLRKDGVFVWGHLTCMVVRDSLGTPLYTIGMFEDITERKQADAEREKLQEQLQQAQKMESVGRLAGGVAHDFNNMLGVIIGHTEVALAKVPADQAVHQDLQEILIAAGRSAELTRQLLAFARKQTANPRVIDLTDTVTSMLKMLRRLIGEHIDLVWQPGPDLWYTRIDPSQVDQMLANLVVNARDAIAASGKVIIETKNVVFDREEINYPAEIAPGAYVMLAVSDNGSGMDRETISKLFEPFFTTKDLGQGTGLGLATVYGIIKQNNGYINVYSEPGQGTIFKIYLPRSEGEVSPPRPAEIVQAPRSLTAEKVLMVEDEVALLELGQEALERQGYVVLVAQAPEKALALAREHAGEIRLLITDVVMPGMNGRALAEEIRAIQPGLKCLFMSGYTADIISNQGVLPEGVSFIQKPFRLKELAQKVRQVIEEA